MTGKTVLAKKIGTGASNSAESKSPALSTTLSCLHEAILIDPTSYTELCNEDLAEIAIELKMVFKEVSEGCATLHKADAGSTSVVLWLFKKSRVHRDGRTPLEITDYIHGLRNPEEIDTSTWLYMRYGWSPMLSAVLSKENDIGTVHSHARERGQSLLSKKDQLKGLALAAWEAG